MRAILFVGVFLIASAVDAQALNDDFTSLTMSDTVTTTGSAYTCTGTPPYTTNTSSYGLTVPSGSGNWAMLASSYYSPNWIGTTTTSSWAISGSLMYTHAVGQAHDDGLAWISRASFDRTKFLSAVSVYAVDTCSKYVPPAYCFAGLTLEASESNYREIDLISTGLNGQGQLTVAVYRNAPCDNLPLYDASTHAPLQFLAAQAMTMRIDYLGPENGGWRYWVNGLPAAIDTTGTTTETASLYPDVGLYTDPHLGLYWAAFPNNGTYVEGYVDRATVYQLQKIAGITATASASYPGYPPSQAIDGDPGTIWNAGAFPTQWIELDLGASTTIRQIRLLPSQTSTHSTTNVIYAGPSPGPTNVIKTLTQTTSDNVWVDVDFLEAGITGRYVRIETTGSTDWVGWREVEVYD